MVKCVFDQSEEELFILKTASPSVLNSVQKFKLKLQLLLDKIDLKRKLFMIIITTEVLVSIN